MFHEQADELLAIHQGNGDGIRACSLAPRAVTEVTGSDDQALFVGCPGDRIRSRQTSRAVRLATRCMPGRDARPGVRAERGLARRPSVVGLKLFWRPSWSLRNLDQKKMADHRGQP